jgi:hypothetical protein
VGALTTIDVNKETLVNLNHTWMIDGHLPNSAYRS